jgi:hypothetical protein
MTAIRARARKNARTYGRNTAKKVTLDDVWVGFAELQKVHKDTEAAIKETQKGLQELKSVHAETEAAIKETQKGLQELKETVKETSRVVGDLGNKFGEEAEYTLVPGLLEKFKQMRLEFDSICRNKKIKDPGHDIYAEVDTFLENGSQAMAVEVKAKLHKADVDGHVRRMEKLRAHADLHGDRRDLFGAMAATVVGEGERNYALRNGFFVIEPSGEDVTVTGPAGSPRVWQAPGTPPAGEWKIDN